MKFGDLFDEAGKANLANCGVVARDRPGDARAMALLTSSSAHDVP